MFSDGPMSPPESNVPTRRTPVTPTIRRKIGPVTIIITRTLTTTRIRKPHGKEWSWLSRVKHATSEFFGLHSHHHAESIDDRLESSARGITALRASFAVVADRLSGPCSAFPRTGTPCVEVVGRRPASPAETEVGEVMGIRPEPVLGAEHAVEGGEVGLRHLDGSAAALAH